MHNTSYNGKQIRYNGINIAKSKEWLYCNGLQVCYNPTPTKDLVWDFDLRGVFVSPQNMFVTDKDPQNREYLIYVFC